MSPHESDQSVFNMAFAYLKRIDALLNLAQQHALRYDAENWFNTLRAIEREVSIKCIEKEKDKKESQSDLDKFEELFKEINTLMANGQAKSNKQSIMIKLHNLDMSLRRFMQAKNMLLPSMADPRFAILER